MKASTHSYKIIWSGMLLLLGSLLATDAPRTYTPAPFSDYQPIIDRMPFGSLPPAKTNNNQAPTATPTDLQAEQQKLAQQVSISCINITPDGGIAVGFSDLAVKPPINHYLRVGMSATGSNNWTVLAADYDNEVATLEKDGVKINLKLGSGIVAETAPDSLSAPPPPTAISTAEAVDPLAPVTGSAETKKPLAQQMDLAKLMAHKNEKPALAKNLPDRQQSYMDRLRERKTKENSTAEATEAAARQKIEEMARKMTEDELKKREREINLSLLEQGASPVSEIQLTAEEEQNLVDKGVLTP